MRLPLPLSRPGNPFFSLYEGKAEVGGSPGSKPVTMHFLGSRDGVLSILGCRPGGGLTPDLDPRTLQGALPSWGLLGCHDGWAGGCSVHWTLSSCSTCL